MKKKTRISLGELILKSPLNFDCIEFYHGSNLDLAFGFFKAFDKYHKRQLVISHV